MSKSFFRFSVIKNGQVGVLTIAVDTVAAMSSYPRDDGYYDLKIRTTEVDPTTKIQKVFQRVVNSSDPQIFNV